MDQPALGDLRPVARRGSGNRFPDGAQAGKLVRRRRPAKVAISVPADAACDPATIETGKARHDASDRAGTAAALDDQLAALPLAGRLALVAQLARDAVFTTSLGIEDQVITAAIAEGGAAIRIATLQTGRLFPETLALIEATRERYGIDIVEYRPEQADIDAYKAKYGLNGFYESVEARHACCGFRKLKPLARALEGADFWVTGLRRGQSGARAATPFAEWDEERGLVKVNPLADWTIEDVRAYVAERTCRSTRSTRAAIPRSAASRAPGRSSPARTSAPAAGGGRTTTSANAACTCRRPRRLRTAGRSCSPPAG